MKSRNLILPFALLAILFAPLSSARAQDKASVLARLDAAARDFHTASASFKFDSIQTDPIPDTDVKTGVTYYERIDGRFRWGAHVLQHNSRPSEKTYIFSAGTLRVSDTGKEADARSYTQFAKYEGYFALGFGASGRELQEQWSVRYLGKEKIGEVETDKLELIAKDPQVRKNIPKVTVWMDTAHAVSLKLIFDEGEGQSMICTYTNFHLNQPLPKTAFTFDK